MQDELLGDLLMTLLNIWIPSVTTQCKPWLRVIVGVENARAIRNLRTVLRNARNSSPNCSSEIFCASAIQSTLADVINIPGIVPGSSSSPERGKRTDFPPIKKDCVIQLSRCNYRGIVSWIFCESYEISAPNYSSINIFLQIKSTISTYDYWL